MPRLLPGTELDQRRWKKWLLHRVHTTWLLLLAKIKKKIQTRKLFVILVCFVVYGKEEQQTNNKLNTKARNNNTKQNTQINNTKTISRLLGHGASMKHGYAKMRVRCVAALVDEPAGVHFDWRGQENFKWTIFEEDGIGKDYLGHTIRVQLTRRWHFEIGIWDEVLSTAEMVASSNWEMEL